MRITVNTKVDLNTKALEELEGEAKYSALYKTADWVLTEVITSGKVPKDTGALEISGFVKEAQNNIVMVVFDTPYARRWYFNTDEAVLRQEYNADAQDHWMDDFIHGDRKQELIETFKEFYLEEVGGLIK